VAALLKVDPAKARQASMKVAAIYAVVAGVWVLLSDRLLLLISRDPNRLTGLQTARGWFFVVASAGLIDWLVYRFVMGVRREDARLRALTTRGSMATGAALFKALAGNLAEALEVDCVLICELTGKGLDTMRSLAAFVHGRMIEGFECRWAGTPCEEVLAQKGLCCYPEGIRRQFPDFPLLDGKPLCNRPLAEELIPFFAMRAAVELDRTQAEEERSRLAAIVDSSDDAIIGKTLDGTIVDWNAGAEKIYGYTAAEIVGKPISVLVPPEYHERVERIREKIRLVEPIDHYETEHLRKYGKPVSVSLTVSPVRNGSGRLIGSSTTARDITRRKALEAALKNQFEQIAAIFDSLDAVVYAADLETSELLYLNRFGISVFRKDWQGRTCCELHIGETGPCDSCPGNRLVRDGEPQPPCHWESHNPATGRSYRCTDKAIRWSDGRLVRLGIAFDFTELRELK
jgi:PAS domain S-box-containing protein